MFTDFQKKVWLVCKKIPKGKITTYKLLAEAINCPGAARAVGNALNKNPYAPKVPCHRVINSDGGLGGFSQGTKKKQRLLASEGLTFAGNKIIDFRKKLFRFS